MRLGTVTVSLTPHSIKKNDSTCAFGHVPLHAAGQPVRRHLTQVLILLFFICICDEPCWLFSTGNSRFFPFPLSVLLDTSCSPYVNCTADCRVLNWPNSTSACHRDTSLMAGTTVGEHPISFSRLVGACAIITGIDVACLESKSCIQLYAAMFWWTEFSSFRYSNHTLW